MKIKIGDSEFTIAVADSPSKRQIGLSTLKKLPKGKGLLMKFEQEEKIPVRMSDMQFPLDLVFIKGNKVQKIVPSEKGVKDVSINDTSDAVLEVNLGEGGKLKPGMEVAFIGEKKEDGTVVMADGGIDPDGIRHVLDEDGKNQMNLLGGERIFSRKDTDKFFKYAKSKDYKKLGLAIVDAINRQDTQDPQYSKN